MNKAVSAQLTIVLTMIVFGACTHFKISTPSVSNPSPLRNDQAAQWSPTPLESNSGPEMKPPVSIASIALYGLWWSDEQLELNFDADNPPPKKTYVKLDGWDASQPDSAHPDLIDIVCLLENHTKAPVKISVEAFADFKVAPYQEIARGSGTEQAVDKKLAQVHWSENQTIGSLVTVTLLPDETREVKFKDFHLRAVIDKYLKPSAGDLWPWKLRISTIAKNSKGVSIARSETTIGLIPGD